MEKLLTIKKEYNTLDTLEEFLKKESSFECSQTYDIWDVRTDPNGQMEQCILLKKSSMHAMRAYFTKENTLKINHVIPDKTKSALLSKSVKQRRSIFEIATGGIKQAILSGAQKKAFAEFENALKNAVAN